MADAGPRDATSGASHREAVDAILEGTVSASVRRRIHTILAPIPASELEALAASGLRLEIEPGEMPTGGGPVTLGAYNLVSRHIRFTDGVLLSREGPHVLLHELTHAIDHMRGERTTGRRLTLASAKDAALRETFQAYQNRALVEQACRARDQVLGQVATDKPFRAGGVADDGWGVRGLEIIHGRSTDRVIIDDNPGWVARGLVKTTLGTVVAVAGMAVGWAPVMVMGGLVAGLNVLRMGKELLRRGFSPVQTSEVPLERGEKALLQRKGPRAAIDLPSGSSSPPVTWSDYAYRSGMVQEYLAEGVSRYLESPSQQAALRQADPAIVPYVEAFLQEAFTS